MSSTTSSRNVQPGNMLIKSEQKGEQHELREFVARLQSKESVDLRLLDYVSDFDRNLTCPICCCPLIQPVRLDCDHTFCQHCLKRALQAQPMDKSCPTCRKLTKETDALPVPRFLVHMLDELIVECPKHDDGCELRMKRGDVEDHINLYCEHAEVACPSITCALTIARKEYGKRCLHCIVSCGSCQMQLMERELQMHKQRECDQHTMLCPHCYEKVVQRSLIMHLQECSEAIVPCIGALIGCSFLAKRIEMGRHVINCTLAALWPTLQSMKKRIDDQGGEMKLLRRKNNVLEGGLAAIQSLVGDALLTADATRLGLPAIAFSAAEPPATASEEAQPFDSATHHLLSLHESLREELNRLSATVAELDARSSMMIMNESLRLKEDMTHTSAVMGSMRMQLQWLTSARLQGQSQSLGTSSAISATTGAPFRNGMPGMTPDDPGQPVRRLSDSSRPDTKL